MMYIKNHLPGFLLGGLLLTTATCLRAQNELRVLHQPVSWLAADVGYNWNKGYSLILQAQERRFLQFDQEYKFSRLERVMPHLLLTKDLGQDWKLGLGQWFFTIAQPADADLPVTALIPEHRTYLSLSKAWASEQGRRLELRSQSEFRLFREDGENHFSGPVDRQDYRQRFQVTYSWPLGDQLRLTAGEELHLTMASSEDLGLFDQNRIWAQISRHWGDTGRLKTSLGFMHWWQATGAPRTFLSRYIWRAQVGYRWGSLD